MLAFAIDNGETGNIWALFVDPEHEGRGHGRRLFLSTEAGTRAERFYERAGWRRIGSSASGETMFEMLPPSPPRSR